MQGKAAAVTAVVAAALVSAAWTLATPPAPSRPLGEPPPAPASNVSGGSATQAKPAPGSSPARFTREANVDRSGNDIRSEHLAPGSNADDCEKRCTETKGCLAYTFVKLSSTVPAPICWLKDAIPQGYPSSCCTSGVRMD